MKERKTKYLFTSSFLHSFALTKYNIPQFRQEKRTVREARFPSVTTG